MTTRPLLHEFFDGKMSSILSPGIYGQNMFRTADLLLLWMRMLAKPTHGIDPISFWWLMAAMVLVVEVYLPRSVPAVLLSKSVARPEISEE